MPRPAKKRLIQVECSRENGGDFFAWIDPAEITAIVKQPDANWRIIFAVLDVELIVDEQQVTTILNVVNND